jgi:hypothetical protein
VGFYSHVEQTGGDPWSTFVSEITATDNMSAFDAVVGGNRAAFSETWGSGYAREPERGAAWDENAPAIPASKPPVANATLRNGDTRTLGATEVSNFLARVNFAADVVKVGVDGERLGRISWDGGGDDAIADVADDLYCGRAGGCVCPEGDSPDTEPMPGQTALLAITGTNASSGVEIVGMSLDELCKDEPAEAVVDKCLVGTWRSGEFEIPSIVPGYTSKGGSGAVVKIRADGSVTWDFANMEPSVSHDEQIGVTTAISSSGAATGQVTAKDGTWDMTQADTGGVTGRLSDTVLGDRPIPGGPGVYVMIGDGQYSCGSGSITYSSENPAEHSTVTVTLTAA